MTAAAARRTIAVVSFTPPPRQRWQLVAYSTDRGPRFVVIDLEGDMGKIDVSPHPEHQLSRDHPRELLDALERLYPSTKPPETLPSLNPASRA